MKIRVECSCGKSLKAPASLAGKQAQCPFCGAKILVQTPEPEPALTAPSTTDFQFDLQTPEDFNLVDRTLPAKVSPPPTRRRASQTLTLDQLRDPTESTALIILLICSVPAWILIGIWTLVGFGVPLLLFGMVYLVRLLVEGLLAAHIRVNGIEVSEQQLPELNEALEDCCEKMNIDTPPMYVIQESVFNAFAAHLAGRRMIVLYSGLVDSILLKGDMNQLKFVVGHEVGHLAAGHLGFYRGTCARMGGWLFWILLWYDRRKEFTCDRIGLYCAGLEASQAALCTMSVGAQLSPQVNIEEAIQQWENHRKEFFVSYRSLYSTHPHTLCRLTAVEDAAEDLGLLN